MVVFKDVRKEDVARLLKKGYSMAAPKTVHEEFRMTRKGVSLVYYKSRKLFLQGKKDAIDIVAEEVRRLGIGDEEKKQNFRKESGWIIGSDETLKGDTFGGIVVAGVKADDSIRQKLLELGVADSKKLRDAEILEMAEKIKRIAPCEIKSLLPEEYNHQVKPKEGLNVTKLLDNLHKECWDYLQPGKHVVDKYPGCSVGDIIVERAESKYIEVAAASVLARAAGLQQLKRLSLSAGFELPKGSTHVKDALETLKEKKLDFGNYVKLHFGNVLIHL